jgi:hypothetical protein
MAHGGKREGAGRPAGKSPLTMARQALLKHQDTIIEALIDKVQQGDIKAIQIAVERLIPIAKPVPTDDDTEEAQPLTIEFKVREPVADVRVTNANAQASK